MTDQNKAKFKAWIAKCDRNEASDRSVEGQAQFVGVLTLSERQTMIAEHIRGLRSKLIEWENAQDDLERAAAEMYGKKGVI